MTHTKAEYQAIDLNAALAKVGGDLGLLTELAELFCVERAKMLAVLQHAVAGGDAPSIRAAAHSLKGSLAVFSAKQAVALAVRLEESAESNQLAVAADILGELQAEVENVCGELRRGVSAAAPQNGGVSHPAKDGGEIS